ncbi:RNA-binding domain-containing protein [Myriangium duriaei CBS 260.36]|uniref:RNA-binding domain-containing protein n=1 Tax=Myriangium duriaei CBS 260.36 TaxID=1168546 RepID=A0A9P4J523_9PEZI|nr:RNA-binding domain-containing protein [Myriangium duriaei CBS 260.36]
MFIGGLNWETTDQSLRDYFTQFGEVTEATVMRDSSSGRSRGFGFLTFRDPRCVNMVVVKEHHLDGKIIDPKRAIPREEQERTSKIFVGGVSQEANEHDFKTFFQQFGRVLDATLMMDKDTGRPRGFGFVTFDSEAAVERTLSGPLEILGKPIEVKKAQPRGNMMNEDDGSGRGRGRGRGGFNQQQGFGGQQNDMMGGGNNNPMMNMGGMGGMGGGQGQGMTPNMMAQYWTRMQQYFSMMQQQMVAQQGGGAGGMNPQMQQQMMQMMMANGGKMNPQMQQQMMSQMQGGNGGNNGGFSPQDQQAFEQQKYERQSQGSPYNAPPGSSWEGMYDDIPAPQGQQMEGGGMGGGGGGGGRGRGRGGFFRGGRGGGGGGGGGGMGGGPGAAPNAPANAPTGPKNAGRPGANYRGGGRGGHRGFHPYSR